MYRSYLESTGVAEAHMIVVDLEDLANYELRDPKKLIEYIEGRLDDASRFYLFLDGAQKVHFFEDVVTSFIGRHNVDIYITLSNAGFIHGHLARVLSGRCLELAVLPLSFKEYASVQPAGDTNDRMFSHYVKGGFPRLLEARSGDEVAECLWAVYHSAMANEIVTGSGTPDTAMLDGIVRVMIGCIGSLVSVNKVKNLLEESGWKIANASIEKYINGILEGLLFYSSPRYDIRGHKLLQRFEKHYLVDVGLLGVLSPDRAIGFDAVIENIVFLELKRRYPFVYTGIVHSMEVGFVAESQASDFAYFQLLSDTLVPRAMDAALKSLRMIPDQYPKFILTTDGSRNRADYGGIKTMPVLDWLLANP
jgi:predicted AAA+ superfamily ATPase